MKKPTVLRLTDPAINKSICRWLREHVTEIDQMLVIVRWKNEDITTRGSMNNMEKLWYMEQFKNEILNRK